MVEAYKLIGDQQIQPHEVCHLIVPGRGRTADGLDASAISLQRADLAARFFVDHGLYEKQGTITSSGYKTPADRNGTLQACHETGGINFGVPEAVSMDRRLEESFIPAAARIIEPYSIDTVTNFAFARNLLPDKRPIGIVSHQPHLERILDCIAPRVLNQPFTGIVVPETADMPDPDSVASRIFSRLVLSNIDPNTPHLEEIVMRRVQTGWSFFGFLRHVKNKLPSRTMANKA